MRIIYLSKYFDVPSDYEIGSRGFHLMKGLSELGHTVTVFTTVTPHLYKEYPTNKRYDKLVYDHLEVTFVKVNKFPRGFSVKRALSWIFFEIRVLAYLFKKSEKPDVVIASSLSLMSVLSALVCKIIFRSKVIFEVRDIYPLTLVAEGWMKKTNPLVLGLGIVEYLGYRFSDHIIGTMANLKEHVKKRVKNPPPVSCIPMGVSKAHLESHQIEADSYSFIPPHKFIIGYAGSMGVANDIDLIIQVARELKGTRAHFVFVGDGPLKEEYVALTNEIENITIGPVLPKRKVAGFLKSTDALIFSARPSPRWKYGQSLNKLIDYLLASKPILALYEGYDDMLEECGASFVVPPFNAKKAAKVVIELMKMDQIELDKLGINGKDWLLKERAYSRLSDEYNLIVESLQYRD